jgi:hypothetical protein
MNRYLSLRVLNLMSYKKSLKIPNAESKTVNRRRADNSMTIRYDRHTWQPTFLDGTITSIKSDGVRQIVCAYISRLRKIIIKALILILGVFLYKNGCDFTQIHHKIVFIVLVKGSIWIIFQFRPFHNNC